ncbi:hypothetical protein ACJIZ3_013873 [Penstemon smallii]|uniref:Uncharacterized protein n=1 Tax=Penstemon smallii TaxID=265156 RepID=A0ABD3RI46_9LAMI
MIPRKPIMDETMKTMILTPNSSAKSSTTMDNNHPSESRDSFYFPGCRKDANCNCSICIEHTNATLDLIQHSSITKFSSSRPLLPRSPVSFNPSSSHFSTPKPSAKIRPFSVSPPLNSTARTSFQDKVNRRKRDFGNGVFAVRIFLGLILILGVEFGFSLLVSGLLKPRFSPNVVKKLGEKSWDFEDLNGRFVFLKNELETSVGKKVSNCNSVDSIWKINQDGLLLSSRCVLYKSITEEVSIWGWPLQAAGLLTADYSSRSLSIISGRVTEWSNGEAKYLVRNANSSWTQGKWSSSVVQFDPNTWILEYKQSFVLENRRPISAVMELLKFRLTREFEKMKQEFWLLFAFGNNYFDFTERSILIPT